MFWSITQVYSRTYSSKKLQWIYGKKSWRWILQVLSYAVKHMEKQQDPTGGCIINITSVHQLIPKPHYIPYATSKAGVEMMTKTLASELAKSNIRANAVAPGAIETPMNE